MFIMVSILLSPSFNFVYNNKFENNILKATTIECLCPTRSTSILHVSILACKASTQPSTVNLVVWHCVNNIYSNYSSEEHHSSATYKHNQQEKK